jgi:Lrp/AsnC family leucine-responsive transcriptional regulator
MTNYIYLKSQNSERGQPDMRQKKINLDSLDMKILESLADDGRITFKELGKKIGIDERLVARRMDRLQKEGIIRGFTVSIDWGKLGMTGEVWVGTRTGVGKELKDRLFNYIARNPNIVEAASSVGTYEYVFHAICGDLQEFRSQIGTPLEPLTAGLSASIITETIKPFEIKPLLRSAFKKILGEGE